MFYAIAQKARTPTLYGPGISSHRLFQASVGSDGECDPARGPCYPERRLLKHPAYRLRSPGAWRTPSAVRSVLFSRRVLTSEPPRPRDRLLVHASSDEGGRSSGERTGRGRTRRGRTREAIHRAPSTSEALCLRETNLCATRHRRE